VKAFSDRYYDELPNSRVFDFAIPTAKSDSTAVKEGPSRTMGDVVDWFYKNVAHQVIYI